MNSIIHDLLKFHSFRGSEFGEIHTENKFMTVEDLNSKAMKRNQLVWFFAHWCGHCKVVVPEWKKLEDMQHDLKGDLIAIDCDKHTELKQSMNIQGYPTFLLLTNENGQIVRKDFAEENQSRTAENFEKFMSKY